MTDQNMTQPLDHQANEPPNAPTASREKLQGTPPSNPNSQSNARASPTKVPSPSPGREHAPPLGTRIEVLWRIESSGEGTDEPGEIVDRWWGAIVQECTTETAGNAVKAEWSRELIHVLLYDAWGEFAEDAARVAFLPGRSLVDLGRLDDENDGVLAWRREGERDENFEMSLGEFADEQDALVHEAGLSQDADLAMLSQYPANVQINVASGYRVFADGVKEMLGELVATKPAGYVVTEQDVQGIFEKIQQMNKAGEQLNVDM